MQRNEAIICKIITFQFEYKIVTCSILYFMSNYYIFCCRNGRCTSVIATQVATFQQHGSVAWVATSGHTRMHIFTAKNVLANSKQSTSLRNTNMKVVKGAYKCKCDVCSQGFMNKGHYEGHMNRHRNYKPHICSTCKNDTPIRVIIMSIYKSI